MKRLILILLLTPALFAQCVWKTIPGTRNRYQDCGVDSPTGASTLTTPGAVAVVGATPGTLAEGGLTDASGTVSGKRAISVDSVTAVALANPTITSVTPALPNNSVTCAYTVNLRAGNNVSSTAASPAVQTTTASTGCAGVVVVFTPDTNASYAQLSRTVGGTTQGLITAMAAWPINTANCPGGVCTYVDTGSAASGAAPTVNGTGIISGRLRDFVSVKDSIFGAVGDGVTDDTAAFTAAIAASRSVTVPCGTYKITGLVLTSSLTLRGEGGHTTVGGSATSCVDLRSDSGDILVSGAGGGLTGVRLENLAFTSLPGGGHAINLSATAMLVSQMVLANVSCSQQNAAKACLFHDSDNAAEGVHELRLSNFDFGGQQASRTVPLIKVKAYTVNTISVENGRLTTYNSANGTYQVYIETTNAAGPVLHPRVTDIVSEVPGGGGIYCGGCYGGVFENIGEWDLGVVPVNPFISIATASAGAASRRSSIRGVRALSGSAGVPDVSILSGDMTIIENSELSYLGGGGTALGLNSTVTNIVAGTLLNIAPTSMVCNATGCGIGTDASVDKLEISGGHLKMTGTSAGWATLPGVEINDTYNAVTVRRWAVANGATPGSLQFRVGTTQTGDPWADGIVPLELDRDGNAIILGKASAAPGGTVNAWKKYSVVKIAADGTLVSGTYTSGISATGTVGQTCVINTFNGGGSGAAVTVALTDTDTIAGGTALVVTNAGTGYGPAPTSGTASNGTAACSGTAVVSTTITGSCQTAKGCWSVNSAAVAEPAAAATSQAVPWLAAPANAELEKVRIKTTTACAGLTAITISDLGTTASASEFFTGGTYSLKTAVGNTNLLWPAITTPGLTAAATNWSVTIGAGAESVDDITAGCAFDIQALWAVLP